MTLIAVPAGPAAPARRTGAARRAVGVLWWLGAAAVLAVVVARATGGGPPTPRPQLTALVLPAAVLAVALVACAAAARRPVATVCGLLLALPVVVWAAPPRTGPDGRAACARPEPFTVMTVNAYFGRVDPAAVVAEVRASSVDALAVQELTPALARGLEVSGLTRDLPHSNVELRPEAAGSGVWVRAEPRQRLEAHDLTFAARGVVVPVPGVGDLAVVSAHPASPWPGREAAWEADLDRLAGHLSALKGPRAVLGDFNATRDHGPFRDLMERARLHDAADRGGPGWRPGTTWPADLALPPFVRLDHVLLSAGSEAAAVRTVTLPGTDHRAVVADLRLCALS